MYYHTIVKLNMMEWTVLYKLLSKWQFKDIQQLLLQYHYWVDST